MALHILTAPTESTTALSAALGTPPQHAAPALRSLGGAQPQVTLPHPVYVLGLDSLIHGKGVADARLTAWRYLVGPPSSPRMAAEVEVSSANVHSFASLNEGAFVADTATQVASAQADSRVQQGDYELRLLRIPALYVVALWLKERRQNADLFVPVGPKTSVLTPGQVYTTRQIEHELRAPALERAKFDDRPKP